MNIENIIILALSVILLQTMIFEIYDYFINKDLHKQWKAEHENFIRGTKNGDN